MSAVHQFASATEAAAACAETIADTLRGAIERNGHTAFAVSGGSTPRLMFQEMARISLPWQRIHIFWVDERCVPPDHADSNYRMTEEALLRHVELGGIHRIQGELPPETAAEAYRRELLTYFDGFPRFDVVHLGMGADGHTASLFPGLDAIHDPQGAVEAVWVPKLNAHRITLLPAAILAASRVVVLAAGSDKAGVLREVFAGPYAPSRLPIQLIKHKAPHLEWYLDRAAAEKLPGASPLTS